MTNNADSDRSLRLFCVCTVRQGIAIHIFRVNTAFSVASRNPIHLCFFFSDRLRQCSYKMVQLAVLTLNVGTL